MKTTIRNVTARHRRFREDLIEVLRKHGNDMSAQELLVIAAHLVGQIVALQDQRVLTSEQAMKIVAQNIEQGNREAIGNLLDSKGSA